MRRGKHPAILTKGRWNLEAGAEGAMHGFMVAQSCGLARWIVGVAGILNSWACSAV